MKLNAKQENRTLEARACEGDILLIERERFKPLYGSRNKWEESRVLISPDEIIKLFRNTPELLSGEKK